MANVNDNQPERLRAVAEQLVSEAADFVRRRRAEMLGAGAAGADSAAVRTAVQTKSSRTDPVTKADTETEKLVRGRLGEMRPGDSILGEEGGGTSSGAVVRWVVDPIDGTVNFLYGIPAYAVSLAAQVGGVSVAGAVADVVGGQVYSAAVGCGAHVLDRGARRRLRCNDVDELAMALLSTGFGYSPQRRAAQAELLAQLMPQVRDVRRLGSAALDLCMVAAGRLDAHYEHGLHEWDWAAGALIAAEAGAVVVLPGADDPGAGLTLAAAPGVAAQLIEALDRCAGLRPLP
ncbi:inositol monophosphatase family protein [Mycolicibacterium sp.]|uniref:inositol monophosphatase family protein n=1 Tax=Mycolicibacterium sp. TaxID=2320850 RepID=UPI0028B06E73|nr:inositol monophosphatase family protein [Mycolicibacterium sp.]